MKTASSPEDQLIALKLALADAITQWASLEDSLALLLAATIGGPANCGVAIYFSVAAAEARFAILDAAIASHAEHHGGLFGEYVLWTKALATLNKARSLRNQIAHGAITMAGGSWGSEARLTGPFLREGSHPKKRTPIRPSSAKPGLSEHDVKAAFDRFLACTTSAILLRELIFLAQSSPLNVAALHERAHELDVHFKTGSAQSGGPPRLGI